MQPIVPPATYCSEESLIRRIATTPGLIKPGVTLFDNELVFPIQPLFLENMYAYVNLLADIARHGIKAAGDCRADVVVGAESAGIPLATAISLIGGIPFAYVRKAGYTGHVTNEPRTRGASVHGKRVMIVDDAVWRGDSLRGFIENIEAEGGAVAGVFVIVDMRPLAPESWAPGAVPAWPPFSYFACCTYHDVLHTANNNHVLGDALLQMVMSCIEERWELDDPRWAELHEHSGGGEGHAA